MFDASKETIVMLHPIFGIGDNFKILGPVFDTRLTMHPTLNGVINKAGSTRSSTKTKRTWDLVDRTVIVACNNQRIACGGGINDLQCAVEVFNFRGGGGGAWEPDGCIDAVTAECE